MAADQRGLRLIALCWRRYGLPMDADSGVREFRGAARQEAETEVAVAASSASRGATAPAPELPRKARSTGRGLSLFRAIKTSPRLGTGDGGNRKTVLLGFTLAIGASVGGTYGHHLFRLPQEKRGEGPHE